MEEDIFLKKEIRNDRLLTLMKKMRLEKTEESMLEVLKEAAGATFVVPVNEVDGHYSFHAVKDSKGRRFVVAFSDTGSFEVTKTDEETKAVSSSFEDLMETVLEPRFALDGVIVNPGSQEVLFGKEMLSMIKQQMSAGDSDFRVGAPDKYPDGMLTKVRDFCEDDGRIDELWIRLFESGDKDASGWLFVISTKVEGDQREYLYDTFKRFIRPYCDGLETVVADKGDEWVKDAIRDVEPFYKGK